MNSYEQKELNRRCDIFGKMFKRSAELGYNSYEFVEQVMTYEGYNNLIQIDDNGQEWCDECFLMRCFENIKPFKKGKNIIDGYILWFMGYLYKYWMMTRKETPQNVYKVLDFRKFLLGYEFYHTQDWEYVVREAIETEEKKQWDNEFTIEELLKIYVSEAL